MSTVLLIGKETDAVLSIARALAAHDCQCDRASGGAGAIRRLRQHSFDVMITDPETTIDEGLALNEEMRDIPPGMKAILLAPSSTPEEIIAAQRNTIRPRNMKRLRITHIWLTGTINTQLTTMPRLRNSMPSTLTAG
jgi:DNA-binding NtrC family response regulator